MRSVLLTPTRLLTGIAALTVLCMLAASFVVEQVAESYLARSIGSPSFRVHMIHEVIGALNHAKESTHNYLVTGNHDYLESYQAACEDVDSSLSRLLEQDREVTTRISHVTELQGVVHEKLTEIGTSLASAGTGPKATAARDEDMSRIGNLLDALAQQETAHQSGELEEARARTIFHRDLLVGLGLINLLFLAGVAFCAIQIKNLQKLITMCAWSKRVQFDGQWIPLEEYLRKRFGIRFSHGISQEEYEKWSANDGEEPMPVPEAEKPRVAA